MLFGTDFRVFAGKSLTLHIRHLVGYNFDRMNNDNFFSNKKRNNDLNSPAAAKEQTRHDRNRRRVRILDRKSVV